MPNKQKLALRDRSSTESDEKSHPNRVKRTPKMDEALCHDRLDVGESCIIGNDSNLVWNSGTEHHLSCFGFMRRTAERIMLQQSTEDHRVWNLR